MRKAWIIMKKEWREVFKRRFVLFTVVFLPLMLTAIPLGILMNNDVAAELSSFNMQDMPPRFAAACQAQGVSACGQMFVISQFILLFMMMPLAIPITIASYSIVGEKTTHTLEPLLATPISTFQLLLGKALAASIPAVVATWAGFATFALGTRFLVRVAEVARMVVDPMWLLAVFVVGPLLAIAAVSVAVMVSSRASDPRVAEQLSMLVILPLLGLFFGQISGYILINRTLVAWMAAGLAVIDAGLFAFATQFFQREVILTRWK